MDTRYIQIANLIQAAYAGQGELYSQEVWEIAVPLAKKILEVVDCRNNSQPPLEPI